MLSYCKSATLFGIEALEVQIEFDVGKGMPAIVIVGLPDTAIKESKDRVRSAINNSGLKFPEKRITINLAPGDVKKEGPFYDLPIALGILSADNHEIPPERLQKFTIVGELSLNGRLRPIRGILPIAYDMMKRGHKHLMLPLENAIEAKVVKGINIYPVKHLREAVEFLKGKRPLDSSSDELSPFPSSSKAKSKLCFSQVQGQELLKRGIEIAVAGGHNLLMIGPPGSGKTMLAKRIPSIFPPMSLDEQLESSKIHSVTRGFGKGERSNLLPYRPFRSPHHTISHAGLIGGGTDPKPGEISLAHHGVLFLDELPEFRRDALEVLREPLEEGNVVISRSLRTVHYPANFMLVAAMNPCPCGYYTDPKKDCRCSPLSIQRYLGKISGPLLDRIDIQVEVSPVSYKEFQGREPAESSEAIRSRVHEARQIQLNRFTKAPISTNSDMGPEELKAHCFLSPEGEALMKKAFESFNLSARTFDRIVKVARTVADLRKHTRIEKSDVVEAIQLRALDRSYLC